MRFIVIVMLLGCALAASVDRDRREDSDEGHNSRVRRDEVADADVEACQFTLWENGLVCYDFDDNFADDSMNTTLQAVFAFYMDVSCVRFINIKNDPQNECAGIEAVGVEITQQSSGCWAHVGCSSSQQTSIQMDPQCNSYGAGVVYHEVFHSLGRFHEQTRQDRNTYVTINWDNILDNRKGNYERCSRELYGIPYDFQSIMHYSDQHFVKGSGQKTMTVKLADEAYNQKLMGSQWKPSSLDILTLNKMYGCYGASVDHTLCKHGGVKKADDSCYCLDPFTGDNCENVDNTKGELTTIGNDDTLTSTNFPGNYMSNTELVSVLECSDTAKRVSITFDQFSFEAYGCGYDYLQYFIGSGDIYGAIKCADELQDKSIESETYYMLIKMKTDEAYDYSGFEATLSCID